MQILETFKILNKLKNVFEKKQVIDRANENSGNRLTEYDEQLALIQKKNAELKRGQSNERSADRKAFGSFSSQASIYKRMGDWNDDYLEEDMKAKKARLMRDANWDDLLFWDKLRLFEAWSLISILANLC
jgi:hypothetical protein